MNLLAKKHEEYYHSR